MKVLFERFETKVGNQSVSVKIYKEDGKGKNALREGFYFELSHFFKNVDDIDIYRHPSNYGSTIDDCKFTLGVYINRFNDIDRIEINNDF